MVLNWKKNHYLFPKIMIIKYKLTTISDMINAVNNDSTTTTFRIGCGQMSDDYQIWLDAGNTPEEIQTAEELAAIEAVAYIATRLAEFPSIGDQLDMLYWDQMNATTIWKDLIESIKTAHPKPI